MARPLPAVCAGGAANRSRRLGRWAEWSEWCSAWSGSGAIFGLALGTLLLVAGCGRQPAGPPAVPGDSPFASRGSCEVTARLVEVPDGAIFKRELYDYATILKYEVLRVQRGEVKAQTIYVGHYNPFKPRSEAADKRVKDVGGRLRQFQAGQVHRMALEVPIDDFFMGGIVNKYFGQETGPIYWAVWTEPTKD